MRVPSPCLNSTDMESLSLSASNTSSVTSPSESRTRTRSSEALSPTATTSTRAHRRVRIQELANIPKEAKLNPTQVKKRVKIRVPPRSYPLAVFWALPWSSFRHVHAGFVPHSTGRVSMLVPAVRKAVSKLSRALTGIRQQSSHPWENKSLLLTPEWSLRWEASVLLTLRSDARTLLLPLLCVDNLLACSFSPSLCNSCNPVTSYPSVSHRWPGLQTFCCVCAQW